MNSDKIRQLLDKFYDGKTTLEEEELLRRYFNGSDIAPEFESDADLFRYASARKSGKAPEDNRWQKMLTVPESAKTYWLYSPVMRNVIRAAAVVFLILTGFAGGIIYSRSITPVQSGYPQAGVTATRFEQIPSASERIKLISQVSGRIGENKGVISSLIQSLNNDNNVNVRLAAAQALYQYSDLPVVRNALVQSLAYQDNPNLQVTLIDMLVNLHEKKAVHTMQVMLLRRGLNPVVRYKLIAGIGVLL